MSKLQPNPHFFIIDFSNNDFVEKTLWPEAEFAQEIKRIIVSWVNAEDPVFQTSGSSGAPRSMRFSQDQVRRSAERTMKFVGQAKTAALVLPAQFTGGKMLIYRALLGKMKLLCYPPALELPRDIEVDLISVSPAQWLKSDLHKCKTVLIGGGSLTEPLQPQNPQQQVFHTYGMTETLSNIAMKSPGEDYFTCLDGVQISTDERGCLAIRDELTGIEDVQTNDKVELLDDKRFRFLQRTDRVINSGGKKINLDAWLLLWKEHSDVEVQPVAMHDTLLGEVLVLLSKEELTEAEWIDACRFLDKHHKPKKIYWVSDFALNQSGKAKTFLYPKDISELAGRLVFPLSRETKH